MNTFANPPPLVKNDVLSIALKKKREREKAVLNPYTVITAAKYIVIALHVAYMHLPQKLTGNLNCCVTNKLCILIVFLCNAIATLNNLFFPIL